MAFSITVLGSSAAIPTSSRNPSGMLVKMNEKMFLIDCGEGTQMQLRRMKIKFQRINHIFISHLHGDHFFGLIGLVSTFHLLGRKETLHIYADDKIRDIIGLQLQASQTQLVYPIAYHALTSSPATIYEDDQVQVGTFPLEHRIPTNGFLFAEKPRLRKIKKDFVATENVSIEDIKRIKAGADYVSDTGKFFANSTITISPGQPRTFAWCSDTRYNESVIDHIKNASLLFHEASFANDMKKVAEEKFHSTAQQAATIAKKADVKQLMIGHFSARYKTPDVLLREAREVFPNTIPAEEGETVNIPSK
jgi:ribonuclease Z